MAFKKRDTAGGNDSPQIGKGNGFPFRVFVATPAYDGRVLTDYAMSLAETCLLGPAQGVFIMASVMGNGAFIDVARNHFVRLFLETDFTHLFFIDADLRWEPRAFIELVRANLPISAGAYRKRQDPEEYPVRFVATEGGTMKLVNGWILADRVASGFLCIRRDVIERMVKEGVWIRTGNDPECPRLFYTKFEDQRFIGEDFAFCDDYVRIFGEAIPVWPDFDFTHGVTYKGNFHAFLNRKAAENEAKEAVAATTATDANETSAAA